MLNDKLMLHQLRWAAVTADPNPALASISFVAGRYPRYEELEDIQALLYQPSLFVNSKDRTMPGSGHCHPARLAMLQHELDMPAHPPVAKAC